MAAVTDPGRHPRSGGSGGGPGGPAGGATRAPTPAPTGRGGRLLARLRLGFDPVAEGPEVGVGGLPWSGAVLAAGVALIACSYWLTRYSTDTRLAMFWAGQVVAFAAPAWRILGTRASTVERYGLVVLYALGQSFTKWAYSPYRFEFGDEQQHFTTAEDLVNTGHYQPNFALPISPHFPVLENVAAAVAQLGRLSIFDAGLVVATAAHVLLAVAVLLLFTRVAGSVRLGCAAALIYATNPHQAYVNTSFVYEVVAIPLLVMVLWLVCAPLRGRAVLVALVLLATIAAAHHVTSYLTAGLLAFLAVGFALARARGRLAASSALLALTMVAAVGVWTVFRARSVLDYLKGPAETLFGSAAATGNQGVVAVPVPGLADTALAAAGVGVVFLAVPVAFVLIRLRPTPPPLRVFVALGLVYYPVVALRFLSDDGQELAGRSFTYVYLGVAPAVGCVAVYLWGQQRGRIRRLTALVIAVALLGAGVSTGWPPSWERLPGTQHVSGFESSVDPQTYQAALWADRVLGPDTRILADSGNAAALSSYGHEYGVDGLPDVFYAPTWTAAIAEQLRLQDISYILVDSRMSTQDPVTGLFFMTPPSTGDPSRRVPAAALAKFAAVPGISCLYNTGVIAVYDVREAVFNGA